MSACSTQVVSPLLNHPRFAWPAPRRIAFYPTEGDDRHRPGEQTQRQIDNNPCLAQPAQVIQLASPAFLLASNSSSRLRPLLVLLRRARSRTNRRPTKPDGIPLRSSVLSPSHYRGPLLANPVSTRRGPISLYTETRRVLSTVTATAALPLSSLLLLLLFFFFSLLPFPLPLSLTPPPSSKRESVELFGISPLVHTHTLILSLSYPVFTLLSFFSPFPSAPSSPSQLVLLAYTYIETGSPAYLVAVVAQPPDHRGNSRGVFVDSLDHPLRISPCPLPHTRIPRFLLSSTTTTTYLQPAEQLASFPPLSNRNPTLWTRTRPNYLGCRGPLAESRVAMHPPLVVSRPHAQLQTTNKGAKTQLDPVYLLSLPPPRLGGTGRNV
ncbi:hypothetical protein GGS23DRAFT_254432 [Durotheca rogersii]|uniref:uncharacterized protein n=1 Tax=Durotheca rogersii TaxID=419775 RepID=UPI00221E8A1B|nr:uncharacterized protein GGS23DRAFT_254432 [Durotheca rogersii]KAI5859923.1 hypothetical protein GGS23DRAFT_254432 [Durotheca rogersii]